MPIERLLATYVQREIDAVAMSVMSWAFWKLDCGSDDFGRQSGMVIDVLCMYNLTFSVPGHRIADAFPEFPSQRS